MKTTQKTGEVARAAMTDALLPHVGRKVNVRFDVENPYIWIEQDGQQVPAGAGLKEGKLVLSASGVFFLMPPRARKNGHPLCAKGSPSNSVMGATIFVADVLDSATGVCLFNEGSGIGV
jgi:hypothetical protein